MFSTPELTTRYLCFASISSVALIITRLTSFPMLKFSCNKSSTVLRSQAKLLRYDNYEYVKLIIRCLTTNYEVAGSIPGTSRF